MSSSGGSGGGSGGGNKPGGDGGLPSKDVKLKDKNLSFGQKNTSTYIELADSRYDKPEVKATIVLFFSKPKKESAATTEGEKAPANVLQKAFDEILKQKEKFEGIYFASANAEMNTDRKGDDRAARILKEGMIRIANDPRNIFNWFYNRPRGDPYDREIVDIEKNVEKERGTKDYLFNITLPGESTPKSKFPLILVYRGRYPRVFYEGPTGTANPKDTENFNKQVNTVKSILIDFIKDQAVNLSFTYDNKDLLDDVRYDQWKRYNREIKGDRLPKVNIFNYIDSAKKGYLKLEEGSLATIPVIPATPSFVFTTPPEPENMLGQKDNKENPENNDLIIVIPKTLPIPKREFPEPRNEEEKKKIQELKAKFEEEKQKIEQKNKTLEIEGIYIPAIPSFYLNDKGEAITIKKK
jgi:hypothetical protein